MAGIAAISLAVAGILVMNVMLVAVTQRTAEIGLLKALGARAGTIRAAFLAEAALLSVAGALAGFALGHAGAWGVRLAFPQLPAWLPDWAVIAALATALGTGCCSACCRAAPPGSIRCRPCRSGSGDALARRPPPRPACDHRASAAQLLTLLGIGVGIAAVILLTSIGEGLHRFVLAEFGQFGTNVINLHPGRQGARRPAHSAVLRATSPGRRGRARPPAPVCATSPVR